MDHKEQPSFPAGGPQFGDYDGWGKKAGNFFKGRGGYVLPILALAILIGGIYFYAHKHTKAPLANITSTAQTATLNTTAASTPSSAATSLQAATTQKASGTTATTSHQSATFATTTPSATTPTPGTVAASKSEYVATAATGDSISSLALQAAEQYMQTNKPNFTVTPEHEIYIQDYIQKNTGSYLMHVGQSVKFSNSLIAQAISASSHLTQSQLHNLSKYVTLEPQLTQQAK